MLRPLGDGESQHRELKEAQSRHGHNIPSLSPAQASFGSVWSPELPPQQTRAAHVHPAARGLPGQPGGGVTTAAGAAAAGAGARQRQVQQQHVCGLCGVWPRLPGHPSPGARKGRARAGTRTCAGAEGKPLCSGRGQCSCSQCSCFESEFGKIYGPFCGV